MSDKPIYPKRTGSFVRVKNENGKLTVLAQSETNWRESARLAETLWPSIDECLSPHWPDRNTGLVRYFDNIIENATRILKGFGIDDPKVPLPVDDRNKLHDPQRMRESADGRVAISLLENATTLKGMLIEQGPKTMSQFEFAVHLMADIADLLHGGDSADAKHARSQPDNFDRDEDIRRRRAAGERVSELANEYDLSEKQISRIAPKK